MRLNLSVQGKKLLGEFGVWIWFRVCYIQGRIKCRHYSFLMMNFHVSHVSGFSLAHRPVISNKCRAAQKEMREKKWNIYIYIQYNQVGEAHEKTFSSVAVWHTNELNFEWQLPVGWGRPGGGRTFREMTTFFSFGFLYPEIVTMMGSCISEFRQVHILRSIFGFYCQ